MATVYAVASAKGGVGKTTTTAAIATVLAESGADVVAIDADVGMANLADALGMVPGETTIHDVLAGRAEPTEAVHDGPSGLRVVPGDPDLDAYAAADPTELAGIVEAFADAEYVFLDSGAGLSHDSTLPVGLADETLLVSTPDRSALGDTEKTRQLAERIGGHVAGAAITRIGGDGDESGDLGEDDGTAGSEDPTVDIVDEILAAEVLGRIPEDPTVARASAAGEPLTTFDPSAPASGAYRELTRMLTGFDVAEPEATGTETGSDPETDADPEMETDPKLDADSETDPETEADSDLQSASETGSVATTGTETDETETDEGTGTKEDADDAADDDVAVAETETVVEESTENDDENEGSAELIGEAEPETDPDDEGDADADEGDADADDGDDIDEDLAGSVPFRDDDTGTMDTALTGASDDERKTGDGDERGDDHEGGDGDEGDGKDDDGKRGFFSRLLGR
ncbi:P-loop NTPase [Halorubrum sp. F4]|uniref:nucleotide-binding protein n=1 Tax=Halorubrum sp. F4 TaxID=2989715 RepID=UPI0024801FB5|nr:P-loop NTPase [Halorubrum sp. F4]